MAKITQARKRKPIVDGEIFSVGANIWNGRIWENFNIGFRETDEEGEHIYTTLKISRAEAERIVENLTEYLNGKH